MVLGKLKVAIVHDFLLWMGGAERCLEGLCEIFPNADIYTLFYSKGKLSKTIEKHKIYPSFLQRFPFHEKYYRYLYTLMPSAVEKFDLSCYDLVISSSWCVAKGALVPFTVPHISYMYTPMRYAWDLHDLYFGQSSDYSLLLRSLIAPQLTYIRMWDFSSSDRADFFIADSKYVARRIKHTYKRDSNVIYPPVDVEKFKIGKNRQEYYLMVTSFEPSKRVDLAVDAFNVLGLNLKIVGRSGRGERRLKSRANPNIEFLGYVEEKKLIELYSEARALIVPGIEDFGISALEASASGTPVIAYAKGGNLESVLPVNPLVVSGISGSPTGVFFYQPTSHSLLDAVELFRRNDRIDSWDREAMRRHAMKFSKQNYIQNMKKEISEDMDKFKSNIE